MGGLLLKSKKDSINLAIKENRGVVVLYGLTFWTAELLKNQKYKVDYVCDRRAIGDDFKLHGIPIVSLSKLDRIIKESGNRATIIICTGIRESVVNSIYNDLFLLDTPADVFNYFENVEEFSDNSFVLDGHEYNLFEHSYNCGYINTRMTERSVELSLTKKYIDEKNVVVEIGAVTPYYFVNNNIQDIVDPTDRHPRVNKKISLFEYDCRDRDVLSISTIEHIGTGDFGFKESRTAVDAVLKITNEAKSCLITAPIGYNPLLDRWASQKMDSLEQDIRLSILRRSVNNHWEQLNAWEGIEYTTLWANGLIVIEKN